MSEPSGRPNDNRANLIHTAISGKISPVRCHHEIMSFDMDGRIFNLPGTGGINLGVHAGDRVSHWIADHLMVGASIEDDNGDPATPGPLHLLSCIGNRVRDEHGLTIGVVAGKRGGLAPGAFPPNLVAVEIPDGRAERLNPGDRVIVEAIGRGLEFSENLDVHLRNVSPRLLDELPMCTSSTGIRVDVCAVVPSRFAGAGLGQDSWIGDLEIVAAPEVAGLSEQLRFGDLVAFEDIDASTNRFYRPGFVSVGLVAHGPSPAPGHGIGVTILASGPTQLLEIRIMDDAGVGGTLRNWADEQNSA